MFLKNFMFFSVVYVVLLFLYTYLVLKLVENIFTGNRKSTIRFRTLVAALNIILTFLFVPQSTSFFYRYLIIGVILFLEFCILYREKISVSFFCASACLLHVMTIGAICTAIFSIVFHKPIYYIIKDPVLYGYSTCVGLLFIILFILFVLNFIPLEKVKIISQNSIHLYFMITWITVFNIYLLCNAKIYSIAQNHPILVNNQLIGSFAILIGLYLVLFFDIKTCELLGYKEKSKELQYAFRKEQQYRESMIENSIQTYEFNLTQNLILNGFDDYEIIAGEKSNNYIKIMNLLVNSRVHSQDQRQTIENFLPTTLLAKFEVGISESVLEYRRIQPNGKYIWVRSITNLVKDFQSGDVKAFMYIKDIDQEKRQQIELQNKAERDSLTSLYNKGTTGIMIREVIQSKEIKTGALFIIDVDNFKAINDHLGHIYGDAVLCELSEKLKEIFQENGIIGRIGGDEFCAFILNPINIEVIMSCGKKICTAFYNTYKDVTGKSYTISGSVGIALFPQDGTDFEELYKKADAALYAAKSEGKNSVCIYDENITREYTSNRTEIDSKRAVAPKNFKENRIEYIFKILYASDNLITAIHAALELVTKHFKFHRGYIFETSPDGLFTSNTYEWCKDGITAEIDNLQMIPIDCVATANASFQKTGMFILNSLEELDSVERATLEPQGIKSMFQFGLFDKNHLLGFIGFDNCVETHKISEKDSDELLTICNVLATFFVKQRVAEYAAKNLSALTSVLDQLNCFTYVVEKDTFKILFMNEKTKRLVGSEEDDFLCYRHFRGKDALCDCCPIQQLPLDKKGNHVQVIYNEKFNIWTETTASYFEWIDGREAYLLNSIDITEYKK